MLSWNRLTAKNVVLLIATVVFTMLVLFETLLKPEVAAKIFPSNRVAVLGVNSMVTDLDGTRGFTSETTSSGEVIVSNGKISLTVPVKYKLEGNTSNFTLKNSGVKPTDTSHKVDYTKLTLVTTKLNDEDLDVVANRNAGENKVSTVRYGDLSGYAHKCIADSGEDENLDCVYLPLGGAQYLYIEKSYSDDYSRGYQNEIETILDSITLLEQPTK